MAMIATTTKGPRLIACPDAGETPALRLPLLWDAIIIDTSEQPVWVTAIGVRR